MSSTLALCLAVERWHPSDEPPPDNSIRCRSLERNSIDLIVDADAPFDPKATVVDLFGFRDTRLWTTDEATEIRQTLNLPSERSALEHDKILFDDKSDLLFIASFTCLSVLYTHAKALNKKSLRVTMSRPTMPCEDSDKCCDDEDDGDDDDDDDDDESK